METFTHLLHQKLGLPTGSALLITALVLLLVGAILLKIRQRQKLARTNRSLSAALMPDKGGRSPLADAAPKLPASEADAADSDPSSGSADVCEVDPLEEVEIYISYGHLEQAATTLRWYVEHHSQDIDNLKRLLDLYLEIPDLDGYAEIQERFCGLFPEDTFCREGIIRGLQADPANLQLRVLAEAYLGMDVDSIDAFILDNAQEAEAADPFELDVTERVESFTAQASINRAQNALKQAIVNPEPLDLSGLDLSGDKPGLQTVAEGPLSLIRGQDVNFELRAEEHAALSGFISPIQLAYTHLAAGDVETAADILRRGTLFEPRKLAYHVELMHILAQHRQPEAYAEALLSLYLTLWGAGSSLRQRLLNIGLRLGHHPLLEHLQDVDSGAGDLALLANAWGLHIPLAAIPFSNPPLVEERLVALNDLMDGAQDDAVLQEFDQLLDYGQVDEAITHLEEAVCADPQNDRYYKPLMEMYERMSDLTRYTQFTESILQGETVPSEETLRLMIEVGERLKRHVTKRAV